MTATVANTANTNTFDYWRNRTNELAYAMSALAVTAGGSNAAVGDAAITGKLTANTISVGNASVNVVISTANSTQISNGQYFLNANGNWGLVAAPTYTDFSYTSGNTAQLIDSYDMSVYGTVEYIINAVDNTANNRMSTKIFTSHNSADVYSSEYLTYVSNTAFGAFTANSNTTHARLYFTPTSTNTLVKFVRFNI
jgi:hypothetical protein